MEESGLVHSAPSQQEMEMRVEVDPAPKCLNEAFHHIAAYQEQFEMLPSYLAADQKYGTQDNRDRPCLLGIRTEFRLRGRKAKDGLKRHTRFKVKQRERNRVEGHIGHAKEHNGFDRVRYIGVEKSEMWV